MKRSTRVVLAAAIAALLGAPLPALAQSASAWAAPATMPNPGTVQAGRAPIQQALLKIIPPPYVVQLDSRIPATTEVAWPDSTDWMYALQQALAPMGYRIEPDWATSTIRILAPAQVASATPAAPVAARPAERLHMTSTAGGSAYVGKPMPAPSTATPHVSASGPKPMVLPHPTNPVPGLPPATYATAPKPSAVSEAGFQPVAPHAGNSAATTMGTTPATALATDGRAHSAAFSSGEPATPTAVGAAYTIPAHVRLAQGLAAYVARFGWTLKWELPRTYVTAAAFPIPALSLQAGLTYVLKAYQAQGDLAGATFALAVPNHIAVARNATATESSP